MWRHRSFAPYQLFQHQYSCFLCHCYRHIWRYPTLHHNWRKTSYCAPWLEEDVPLCTMTGRRRPTMHHELELLLPLLLFSSFQQWHLCFTVIILYHFFFFKLPSNFYYVSILLFYLFYIFLLTVDFFAFFDYFCKQPFLKLHEFGTIVYCVKVPLPYLHQHLVLSIFFH